MLFALEYSSEDLLDEKRPCDNEEDEMKLISFPTDGFMSVYQNRRVARLLKKYENEMCPLDVNYEATRYTLITLFGYREN